MFNWHLISMINSAVQLILARGHRNRRRGIADNVSDGPKHAGEPVDAGKQGDA